MVTYLTSRNYKNSVFLDLPTFCYTDAANMTYSFCLDCRKFTVAKPQTKQADMIHTNVCPHCGRSHTEVSVGFHSIGFCAARDDSRLGLHTIDSVTFNQSVCEDGSYKDINGTIFFRDYLFAKDGSTQQSYTWYQRVTCNFETNQIYLITQKPHRKGYPKFKHYVLNQGTNSFDQKLAPMLCSIILSYYNRGLPSDAKRFPLRFSHADVMRDVFTALKFPVLMWLDTYLHAYSPDMTALCHFACNHDKTLRDILTLRSVDDYREQARSICSAFLDFDGAYKYAYHPVTVVYARYMYQLGFRSFDSVKRVAALWLSSTLGEACDTSAVRGSRWIFDFTYKRDHVRNKFYRRFLRRHGEYDALLQFLSSQITVDFAAVTYVSEFQEFWKILHETPSLVDTLEYSLNCDAILISVICTDACSKKIRQS